MYSRSGPSSGTSYNWKRSASGANIASAMPNLPNSHSPPCPYSVRASRQIRRTRSMSACAFSLIGTDEGLRSAS